MKGDERELPHTTGRRTVKGKIRKEKMMKLLRRRVFGGEMGVGFEKRNEARMKRVVLTIGQMNVLSHCVRFFHNPNPSVNICGLNHSAPQ
jgi:hypothetical protein